MPLVLRYRLSSLGRVVPFLVLSNCIPDAGVWMFRECILHVNYILCIMHYYVPQVLMLSQKMWRHNDVVLFDVRKRSTTVWRVNFSTYSIAKIRHFCNISLWAQLAYKIYPIKFYREWPNLNTVKISFCMVAVPPVKFAIKDFKTTEKHQTRLPYPYIAPCNIREEGQHRRISVDPENRNVRHTKMCYDTFIHWLIFSQFGWFVNLLLCIEFEYLIMYLYPWILPDCQYK